MSRYFQTTNASRRFVAGDFAFTFEPTANIGGSWLGVLVVEDSSAANALATAGHPQVKEITGTQYELEKKKRVPTSSSHGSITLPKSNTPPAVGAVVPGVSTVTPKAASAEPVEHDSELKTAVLDVPDELRLAPGAKPPARR